MFWLSSAQSSAKTPSPNTLMGDATPPASPCRNHGAKEKRTVLLKIGRASNVQRRMNQWTRQCGYDLSVVRFYPHQSSSSGVPSDPGDTSLPGISLGGSSNSQPITVPYLHKVERLIHLELADKRVSRDCEACGKVHREWFEVNANSDGVKGVDEICKRWCRWAEGVGRGV